MALDLFSIPLLVLYSVVGLAAYWYLYARPKNAPPGPIGFPYIGYAPFLSTAAFMDFDKLGKKYKSNIISLYLGPVFTVVLNDWDAVRAAFVDQDENFTGRPKENFISNFNASGEDGQIHSIIALEGPKWKAHHIFIHDSLEELGVQKPKMEKSILEEIDALIQAILEEKGGPFQLFPLSSPTTSSIVARQAFGHRWAPRSDEFTQFMTGTSEMFQLLGGSPPQVMPWTRNIPGPIKQKWEMTQACMKRMHAFFRELVRQHEETYEPGRIRDFADVYIRHRKGDGPLDPITFQNEEDFVATATTLFQAGGEATNACVEWCILFLLHNPQIQLKIHEEIESVIGTKRPIVWSDKESIPYTTGAIYESFRLGGNSALGVPRSNFEATQLHGYDIPKRSQIMMNIWSCHRSPKDWKYPEEFNPNNWINDDGQFFIPEAFLAFSNGSRKCPGQELAKMMVFMVLANLLQKFVFVNPLGQKLPGVHEYVPGVSARTKPFYVQTVPRG